MKITKVDETSSAIILGWDAVPDAEGYVYLVDEPGESTRSHTFDGTVTKVKVSKKAQQVTITAIGHLDQGVWSPSTPPEPTPDVTPPAPPATYVVPASAVLVKNTGELVNAINAGRSEIVLEDGVYDNPGYLTLGGKHLYSRNLGKATVKFGFWDRGGARLQGLVLDVASNGKCLQDSILRFDGSHTVLDCTLKGNKAVAHGLYGLGPNAAEVRRYVAGGFTDTALRLSSNHEGSGIVIKAVSDISIDGVTRSTPGASDGTAEAGVWIGEFSSEGVRRVRVRNVSWSGIEGVNNCNKTAFSDLDIDMGGVLGSARVAFYAEHFCVGGLIERFLFTNGEYGFVGEWADPVWGTRPAVVDHTIRNGKVVGCKRGIYYDDGSGPGNKIDSVHFKDVQVAVAEYKPKAKATLTNLSYENVKTQYSTEHYGGV